MFPILASVPGKLKTLLDRITSTRAANLDKLDANITTRAAASTALSNATWTDAVAGRIDVDVSSRATPSPLTDPPTATLVVSPGNDTTTSGSYATLHSYSGRGVVLYAGGVAGAGSAGNIKVLIDGVEYSIVSFGTSYVFAIGLGNGSSTPSVCMEAVPFNTSFEIQGRLLSGSNPVIAAYRYRKC